MSADGKCHIAHWFRVLNGVEALYRDGQPVQTPAPNTYFSGHEVGFKHGAVESRRRWVWFGVGQARFVIRILYQSDKFGEAFHLPAKVVKN